MNIPNPILHRCFLAQALLEHSVDEWCVRDERLMSLYVQVPASIYQHLLINLEMYEKCLTFVEDFFYLRST